MTKMDTVMTVRLPEKDVELVKELSILLKKDKSTMVRELVEQGKIYFAIMQYQEGKASISKAAEIAGLPLSELIDLLAKFGIQGNLEIDDYLAGVKTAKGMF
ncbi:MAG: UPF0175 family protein [Candidatus Woesearchaeota archaeon]